MNRRPNRTCRPVPLHLGQAWNAYLKSTPFSVTRPLHLEHFTHGLIQRDPM